MPLHVLLQFPNLEISHIHSQGCYNWIYNWASGTAEHSTSTLLNTSMCPQSSSCTDVLMYFLHFPVGEGEIER